VLHLAYLWHLLYHCRQVDLTHAVRLLRNNLAKLRQAGGLTDTRSQRPEDNKEDSKEDVG
jgi:hypothetical protein